MNKIISILCLLILFSCDHKQKVKDRYNKGPEKKKKKNGLSVTKYDNGQVKTHINYKDGFKHGEAKNYYKNGKLKITSNYINGEKDGVVKYYYKSGQLYKETPYKYDKIHGIKKVFRESGKIRSESPYNEGAPGIELKEYLTNGNLKTKYPKIIVKAEDKTHVNNKYYLHITLTEEVKNLEFFRGVLKDDKWFVLGESIGRIETINNEGKITITIPGGYTAREKINIIATYKTRLGNIKVLQKVYNLDVSHV